MSEQQPIVQGFAWLVGEHGVPTEISRRDNSPWLCVDYPDTKWAIWVRTGAVHRVQDDDDPYPGAVEDDPRWQPEEAAVDAATE